MNKYTNSYDSTKPYTRLTEQEREYIAQELLNKKSIREIATRLGRSPSTISREVKNKSSRDKIIQKLNDRGELVFEAIGPIMYSPFRAQQVTESQAKKVSPFV